MFRVYWSASVKPWGHLFHSLVLHICRHAYKRLERIKICMYDYAQENNIWHMSCTFHGCKIYKIFHNNVQDWTHDAQRSRNGYFHGNYPAAKTIRDLGATSTQRLRLSSILLLRFFNSLYFLRLGVPVSPFLPLPLLLCFLDIRSIKNN